MDEELKNLLTELKKLASDDLRSYSHAQILLNNVDDAAILNFRMGDNIILLPLIHVEVIAMFNEFLDQAIEYYREETK